MIYNESLLKTQNLKIKIFGPLSNKNWLEEEINTWLNENQIEVNQMSMTFSDDKYVLTILYKENLD